MPVTLRTLAADTDLPALTDVLRHVESLGFRVLSIAAGEVSGLPGNLATFREAEGLTPPAKELRLERIDGVLGQAAQQALLTAPGRECVCYGTLFVSGTPANVAVFR